MCGVTTVSITTLSGKTFCITSFSITGLTAIKHKQHNTQYRVSLMCSVMLTFVYASCHIFIVMLSVIHAECHIFYFYVQCCHIEYQYAEYRSAECPVTHDTSYTSENDKNSGDIQTGTVFSFAQKDCLAQLGQVYQQSSFTNLLNITTINKLALGPSRPTHWTRWSWGQRWSV